jgi:acetyl-CoA acetyltransferase
VAELPEKLCRITGIGQTLPERTSAKRPIRLFLDAALEAIADAGLTPGDIDGITSYPPKSVEGGGISPVSVGEAAAVLGIEPRWINACTHESFGHMSAIFDAVLAVASGLARHVLVFRTVAQAQARSVAKDSTLLGGGSARVSGNNAWTVPFKAVSPVNLWALYAQAYFDKYGATAEQLGWVAVNGRRHAALNPNALYRKPITIDDYMASRLISTPLRLYDCDTHIDGATALVISHRDAAKDCPNPPIHIEAMGMSVGGLSQGIMTGDFTSLAATRAGDMLWQRTDLKPSDIDNAQVYDGFSIHTLLWLEAVKLVGEGEAAAFVEGGERTSLTGQLPLNTGGGQLSAGRFHGYGHTHEACVQLWNRGGARQVQGARASIICNGGYGYGALLLRRD